MIAAIAVALMLQAQPAAASDAEWATQTQQTMDVWKLCILGTAKSWSQQTAQPSDIAEGALGHCAALLVKVEAVLRSSKYLEPADVDRLIVKFKATWRERAIATVLEERARVVRRPRTK